MANGISLSAGAPYSERAGDGRHGAGDQHDGDHAQDRGAEQAGEGGGQTITDELFSFILITGTLLSRCYRS